MDKELIKEMRQAIKKDDLQKVKLLIDNNEGLLNEVTPFGTWLHDATTFASYELVKYFVEQGIDVNKRGGIVESVAIKNAAFKGKLDMVKLLYENGAKLYVDDLSVNPLFAAIYNNHIEVAKFLVEKGIDLTANYAMGDLDKVDAYEYARQYGRTEMLEFLRK